MIVLITGATGFIGKILASRLAASGHSLRILTRNPNVTSGPGSPPPGAHAFAWDGQGPVPAEALRGAEAVVHLAGENIGARWTAARKRRILESRVLGTRALVEGMRGTGCAPAVLVAASAVGYYGNGGDQVLSEDHPPGKGFLAEVCMAWEGEIFRARELGVRTVAIRNGLVLGQGGALEKLLPLFRFGLGGVLGSGRQWWSWIHGEDAAGLYAQALENAGWSGPVNGCAPAPVTQQEFARALAKALHRPLLFRVPALALRAGLGEMAATLLEGQKADASRAGKGYAFRYGNLDVALAGILAKGWT